MMKNNCILPESFVISPNSEDNRDDLPEPLHIMMIIEMIINI